MNKPQNYVETILYIGREKNIALKPMTDFVCEAIWNEAIQKYETKITKWLTSKMPQPTQQQIDDAEPKFDAWFIKQQYKQKRAEAYPSVVDQLDMLWHGYDNTILNGGDWHGVFNEWFNAVKKVKQQYPKL